MASGMNVLLQSFKGAAEHGKLGRLLFLALSFISIAEPASD